MGLQKKMGMEILAETKAEKIMWKDNLYHIETKNITSFFKKWKKSFQNKRYCCGCRCSWNPGITA